MSDVVIRVENLGKKYIIGHQKQERYTALRDVLANGVKNFAKDLIGRRDRNAEDISEEFWALKDVSFEINQGDRVGIIGRNGAGKSTLLKILSRITEPTSGKISIKGRVASLLEVGTGFHPELTGRENIYLNGAILGMDRAEIKKKFDEIVAFAEVEKFLDTPVKRYSSGMYVRLAFAVAAHLEPEILIVDEVLAVGDASFQKKCLGKMEDVSKEGRTIIFVSHNMAAVEKLCNQAFVLHQGNIQYMGSKNDSISFYLANQSNISHSIKSRTDRKGTGELKIVDIEVKNERGESLNVIQSGQDINIYFYFEKSHNVCMKDILVGFIIRTQLEIPVFLQHNVLTNDDFGYLDKSGAFVCSIKKLPLVPSEYRLTYSVMSNSGNNSDYIDTLDDAIGLTVVEGDFFGTGRLPQNTHGFCLVNASWYVDSLN